MPTKKTTTKKSAPKTAAKSATAKKAPAKGRVGKRVSAIDAAARLLKEVKTPLTTAEMVEQMATKGYWRSPGGKTPAATLYSAILREIGKKKGEARFKKTERGKFQYQG